MIALLPDALKTGCLMSAKIINRGRGPEIEGTRITVYDIFDYARQGWHRDRIATLFRLSSRDVQAALDNIEGHFVVLLRIWTSDVWASLWEGLEFEIESFDRLGPRHDASDRDLWQVC